MKPGLIEKIKSRGYWRFNFQPINANIRLMTLKECRDIVEKNSINLRGWDYPHIPLRQDENGSIINLDNFIEAWEDWSFYKEFWRMYKSGQFLYYRGLREDWFDEHHWKMERTEKIEKGKNIFLLTSVIYELTETFLFLSRLAETGLYREGVSVSISLHNTKNRSLYVDDYRRTPFFSLKMTGAEELKYPPEEYSSEIIISDSKKIAQKKIIQVFDSFGWNPPIELISSDQEIFLSGKIL